MGLAQRVKSGSVSYHSAAGPSLLDSLWKHLLTEWADPDSDDTEDFDAGYTTGLAYAIAKITAPYSESETRIEAILYEARQRIEVARRRMEEDSDGQ